ncbi:MAG TPA: RNA-binding protein [Mariprofundaceae bacterium]|nr:RNA-binding protein [Mariprofundaceae bacterium]
MRCSGIPKLLAVAAVISLIGYYAQPYLGMGDAPVASIFATGLLAGVLLGGLLANCRKAAGSKSSSGKTTIYVGNLPFGAGKDEVKNIFAPYGKVIDVRIVKDRRSRRSKGYGFVEMAPSEAKSAIQHLNGTEYAGRTLRINEAQEKGEQD